MSANSTLQQQRWAISAVFFISGFLYATWTSRVPEIEKFYSISHTMLGTLLFISSIGSVLAMPFAGWFVVKFGSERMTQVTVILSCLFVPLVVLTPQINTAFGIFFFMGALLGILDVSMNGQSVYLERAYKRPILSSFHAVFSVGMAMGALVGYLFSSAKIGLLVHFTVFCGFALVIALVAIGHLVSDPPTKAEVGEPKASSFQMPSLAVLPLGLIAFCCMTGEGAMADWSSLYMHEVVGKSESFSIFAYGAFAIAMTVGRLFGDSLTLKLGKRRMLLGSSLLSALGLLIAVGIVSTPSTLIGFFLIGLGLATVVPIIYSTAGNLPGITPSVGIAMATTVGYAGFFVGPPVIGFLADAFGLRFSFGMVGLLFVLMLVLVMTTKRFKSPAPAQT